MLGAHLCCSLYSTGGVVLGAHLCCSLYSTGGVVLGLTCVVVLGAVAQVLLLLQEELR